MKIRNVLMTYSALALALGAGTALAQDDGEGDEGNEDPEITISLVPEDFTLPMQATRTLELPPQARLPDNEHAQAEEHAGPALEAAMAAREAGRLNAETARQAAQESREEFGRGHMPDLEDLPGSVPEDLPGPPDTPPGPPESPPGAP